MLKGDEYGILRYGDFSLSLALSPVISGSDSKAVLKATMDIAQANFPEMLFKNHIVNAPWIFNTIVSPPPLPLPLISVSSVPPSVVFCERLTRCSVSFPLFIFSLNKNSHSPQHRLES
jgi:hypothetical protein